MSVSELPHKTAHRGETHHSEGTDAKMFRPYDVQMISLTLMVAIASDLTFIVGKQTSHA